MGVQMPNTRKPIKKIKYAESRARAYTKNELKLLNWDTRHPAKGGHVLEEQEAKHFDERFDELLGNKRPDFFVYYENENMLSIVYPSGRDVQMVRYSLLSRATKPDISRCVVRA